jgi:hypothetical protein
MDDGRKVRGGFKTYIERIYSYLESLGYEVISAHIREGWGAKLDTPEQAIALDFAGIDMSDALVVLMGMAPSEGVPLEIGYAVGRGKPIVVVLQVPAAGVGDSLSVHYLLEGLPAVAKAAIRPVHDLGETEEVVREGLERVL